MEILTTVGKILLVLFIVTGFTYPLVTERRNYKFALVVWRRFDLKLFFQALGVITVVVTLYALLIATFPILRWGWLNLIYNPNGVMSGIPILEMSKPANVTGMAIRVSFIILILLAIPFLVNIEEELFRDGYLKWSEIRSQSVWFGFIHCIGLGIPLAGGIAFTFAGLYLGYVYKRTFALNFSLLGKAAAHQEALMKSTALHAMYNTIIFCTILLYTILPA